MMNRLLFSALAIFCFVAVSCTEGTPIPDYGKDHIVLNVFNSPMTMAESSQSTEYERQLNRLDCFFYVKDKTNEPCVYYHKAEVNDLGSATIPFIVDDLTLKEIFPSGSLCDVFVIANLPGNPTFEAKTPGTTMQALGEYVLDMTEGEYDVKGKPFVMTGSNRVQKGNNSNATADIALKRVASKITMTVRIPKSIEVENGGKKVKMVPVLVDNEGNEPLKTSFRYGTNKSYLSGEYPNDPNNYIWTDKIPYTQSKEKETDTHYVFACDIPFYTYARSWEKGADNAAYVTFEMPWGADENNDNQADTYKTYYYQILVNGKGRNFVPNTHYDMIVTVGVLGSSVEALPAELDVWSYCILDWTQETQNGEHGSGDRDEDVKIEKFNYLEVPQTYIEMDNVSEVAIRYNASHKIGVKFADKKNRKVEGLESETNLSIFYIENVSGTPDAKEISENTLEDAFEDNNKGSLIFKCDLSELQKTLGLPYPIYSPVYVFITIWLDLDGDGVYEPNDKDNPEILKEDVKIVIYPAIYIIGDKSALYSVFVNGTYRQTASKSDYTFINGEQVGKAVGTDGNDPMMYMNIISISAFSKDNTFVYKDGKEKEYIIGDPRQRTYDNLGVGDDTEEVKKNATGWIKATDVNGKVRNLQHYYPTESKEDNSYQVIAPKFRIASKLGGYSECSTAGAALRCASYQEHGFPAGRWRLPTTAEILFIVELQKQGKIKALFYGGNTYASATDKIKVNNNNSYEWNNSIEKPSVRCVYDDWYWGSERKAIPNSSINDGGYKFTWGDEKIY